jgi:histone H3/H4
MPNFKEILNNIGKEVLSESNKKAISEAFEQAVAEKVNSRVKMEVETAMRQLDEDHSQKLDKLLTAIDADHTGKLKKVLEKVDSDYADKLQKVIERYESMLQKEAVEFREQLVSEISNFMDLYIDEKLPREQIQEAVDNTQAKKIVNSIKQLVAVDEDFITENIKEALEDGKEQIDSLRTELHEAMKANIRLNQEYKSVAAQKILLEKTSSFDNKKKDFIMRVLSDKSPDEINENFDYALEMFENGEESQATILKEEATKELKSKVVDTPQTVITETVTEEQVPESAVDSYYAELKNM